MKNWFMYLFGGRTIGFVIVVITAIAVSLNSVFDKRNEVTATQWEQTLKSFESHSKGPTSCDVRWENRKMVVTFHFNDITNSFFRD